MLPKSLRPLYPYLKKYRRGFMVGTICVLLLNAIAVQSPQVIRVALDYLEKGGRSTGKLGFYALAPGSRRRRQRNLSVPHPLDHDWHFA